MADPTTQPDYDGCSRDCRIRGSHTLAWGSCAHATEPEPTVMFLRHFTASDGEPALDTVTITVSDLADELEDVLRSHGCADPAMVAEAVAAHLAQKANNRG